MARAYVRAGGRRGARLHSGERKRWAWLAAEVGHSNGLLREALPLPFRLTETARVGMQPKVGRQAKASASRRASRRGCREAERLSSPRAGRQNASTAAACACPRRRAVQSARRVRREQHRAGIHARRRRGFAAVACMRVRLSVSGCAIRPGGQRHVLRRGSRLLRLHAAVCLAKGGEVTVRAAGRRVGRAAEVGREARARAGAGTTAARRTARRVRGSRQTRCVATAAAHAAAAAATNEVSSAEAGVVLLLLVLLLQVLLELRVSSAVSALSRKRKLRLLLLLVWEMLLLLLLLVVIEIDGREEELRIGIGPTSSVRWINAAAGTQEEARVGVCCIFAELAFLLLTDVGWWLVHGRRQTLEVGRCRVGWLQLLLLIAFLLERHRVALVLLLR